MSSCSLLVLDIVDSVVYGVCLKYILCMVNECSAYNFDLSDFDILIFLYFLQIVRQARVIRNSTYLLTNPVTIY